MLPVVGGNSLKGIFPPAFAQKKRKRKTKRKRANNLLPRGCLMACAPQTSANTLLSSETGMSPRWLQGVLQKPSGILASSRERLNQIRSDVSQIKTVTLVAAVMPRPAPSLCDPSANRFDKSKKYWFLSDEKSLFGSRASREKRHRIKRKNS